MPGLDGTGPFGQGPMTGGRRGYCAGAFSSPGAGRGRGWRNQYYATGLTGWQRAAQAPTPEPAEAALDPLSRIEGRIDEVLQRLERLEAAGDK
ncbi:MAG: DUF5320 domain-containing protein [Actinobacteria bacterium]|nr:DUF5320 domain-containing protein [Actinomycetota bacterium]